MSINVWPLDAVTGAPSYTGRALRETTGGVWLRDSGRPLGARSGVVSGSVNNLSSLADISGTTYTIKPHVGVLDLEANAAAGPYTYAINANITGTTAALSTGQYRRDMIAITLSDPAEDASSVPGAALTYTTGVPNSVNGSAVAPGGSSLSLGLAVVLVPPTGSPSITWIAPVTVAAGGILPMPASGSLGGGLDATEGQFLYYTGATHVGPLFYQDSNNNYSPLVQGGNESYTILSGTAFVTGTVSFTYPGGNYVNPPIVVGTSNDGAHFHTVAISSINTGGFTYRINRSDGTNASSDNAGSFHWIAIP